MAKITMGQPDDYKSFMCAVIDDRAYNRVHGCCFVVAVVDDRVRYIERAKADPDVTVLAGGTCDNSEGYFIEVREAQVALACDTRSRPSS